MNEEKRGFNTKLIHAGEIHDQFGSATVPIIRHQHFLLKVPKKEQNVLQEKVTVSYTHE